MFTKNLAFGQHLKSILLACTLMILASLSNKSSASHILGGEITYTYLGASQYKFTIVIYRDCSGISFNTTSLDLLSNQLPGLGTIQCSLTGSFDASATCTPSGSLAQLSCSPDPANTSGSRGSIAKFVFESGAVDFTGIPQPGPGGYVFTTSNDLPCCRNSNDNTAGCNGSMVLRLIIYRLYAGGDQSPYFAEPPAALTVVNALDTFSVNNNCFDPDLDSLSYSIDRPWSAINTPCSYNNPNVPVPNLVSFNQISGALSFRPLVAQQYLLCIRVNSYRCGVLVASVFRDFMVFVIAPPAGYPTNQRRPDVDAPFKDCLTGAPSYVKTYFAGDTVLFRMAASDNAPPYNPPAPPQVVSIYYTGNIFGSNGDTTIGCNRPPCAYLRSPSNTSPVPIINRGVTQGYGFKRAFGTSARFFWPTNCKNLDLVCDPTVLKPQDFSFTCTTTDDQCPIPGRRIDVITITLKPQPKLPTPLIRSISLDGDKYTKVQYTIQLDSNILSGASCDSLNGIITRQKSSFKKLHILRSKSPSGPFRLVDTLVYKHKISSFDVAYDSDKKQLYGYWIDSTVSSLDTAYYYKFYTESGCDKDRKDTTVAFTVIRTKAKYDNVLGAGIVKWNPPADIPHPTSAKIGYKLERMNFTKEPGIWRIAAESLPRTNNTEETYNDFYTACKDSVIYRISLEDSALPLKYVSISKPAGTLFFDTTPPQKIQNLTVNVDSTINKVRLNWDVPIALDTKGYIIYKMQMMSGALLGVPIDTVIGRLVNQYVVINDDPSKEINTYAVSAFDSCKNMGLLSEPLNNIRLIGIPDYCFSRLVLNWNAWNVWKPNGIDSIQLLRSENGASLVLLNTFLPGTDSSYIDTSFISGNTYCYVLQAYGANGTLQSTSLSNRVCLLGRKIIQPKFLHTRYLNADTTLGTFIELGAIVDTFADTKQYRIYRSETDYIKFKLVDTIGLNQLFYLDGYKQFYYKDSTAKPTEKAYFYLLKAVNICDSEYYSTDTLQSMFLTGDPNLDYNNYLNWSKYRYWNSGVRAYHIYRKVRSLSNNYSYLTTVAPSLVEAKDNIELLTATDGNFCYVIQAVEDGPNVFNYTDTSRSNIACVSQQPRLFRPTAFVPDGLNRVFLPTGVFIDDVTPGSYAMKIYNRWGQEVFSTSVFGEGWDGTFSGKLMQEGVYMYTIEFLGSNGLPYFQKGSFTLLR